MRSSVDAHLITKCGEMPKQVVCFWQKSQIAEVQPRLLCFSYCSALLCKVSKIQMGAYFKEPLSPMALAAFLLEKGI